ncbi:RTA1 like protein-domain-containing protein [Stachybotrys elegans]|uniref:RTA1 like protein-domain-containing protein n=1 Tax=Stachybotrys elegans TaxID=80388 RepID=A0A8K0WK23_9HYPO|nr:RTA1 like protein-domain-containing protein [Stachybotrys elegans]
MSELYTLEGNAFFVAAYGALLLPQIFLGVRCKTWGFLFGMFAGLVLEIIAYVGRIQLHYGNGRFVMYIVCITIGPAFISAAIYLCLARLVVVYGEHLSRFRPRTIAITFMILDFVALLLQCAGGATVGGDNPSPSEFDRALAILQAGLSVHLAGIVLFVIISGDFAFTVCRNKHQWNQSFSGLHHSRKFQVFIMSLAFATLCILVRTAYRVAELVEGFYSDVARDENLFFGLEGAMVVAACLSLTFCHPGWAFQNAWADADFKLKIGKKTEQAGNSQK